MSQKINKNSLPRVKIVQKIYNLLMNPNTQVEYPKSQYKKFIKDVVEGTLERSELIESTINEHLNSDIDLKKNSTILFCPGAASFDQYKNFEERGKKFKTLITRKFV